MTKMNCSNENKYFKNGICCDQCPAGTFVKTACESTKATKCVKCAVGYYTATNNSVNQCHPCRACSSDNNLRTLEKCTSKTNTVCQCMPGFFCTNDDCDHCQLVTTCPSGEGVKVPASRRNNTQCVTCEEGTYSNVTDYLSPCKPHTRCEDFSRSLKVPGTAETDAICGDIWTHTCPWMLPAGLWAGFVLTALILFAAVICWRAKRRSCRADSSRAPTTVVEMAAAAPATSLELSLPSTEPNDHCQESCTIEEFKLPLFNQDLVSCTVDSSLPITPLKVSVSFAESSYIKNSSTGNFLRTYSEPQEDEWCGVEPNYI